MNNRDFRRILFEINRILIVIILSILISFIVSNRVVEIFGPQDSLTWVGELSDRVSRTDTWVGELSDRVSRTEQTLESMTKTQVEIEEKTEGYAVAYELQLIVNNETLIEKFQDIRSAVMDGYLNYKRS